MHLSKLQGKRSLGLSALLAQRQSDAKPIGPPQSPGDEPSSESKFHVSDDPSFPDQTFAPMAQRGLLTYQEEASSLTAASISETAEVQILPDYDVSTSAGVANWPLYGDQCAGTATWQLGESLVESQVIVQPQSQNQQASEAQTISISPLLTSQADVNIFYQNSRDISAIFVEKQKKMIVDLNAAAASLKLQLQFMQQERDDAVLEVSTLHVTIEEQKHEQQTQLLSFSLKMLQDEAEMRKLNDKIHAMSGETNMFRQCLKDIHDAVAPRSSGSHDALSISQKIASIYGKYFPNSTHEKAWVTNQVTHNPEHSSSVEAIMLSLDHELASKAEALRPIFEDMDKKYLDQQLKKESEIANLAAQIQHLEALNLNLQKRNSHALFNALSIDDIARKNAKKCDEHEAVIQRLQEEISVAHQDLKDHDVVLLHCLRDINVVRSEYVTLEMERRLQYHSSERDLVQRMQLSSEQVVEMNAKLQNYRELLVQKDSCLDDLRSRCELLTVENGVMIKKLFSLESSCSDAQSALSRCKGELEIALLEKQMLTKIDDQRRLSQLQSSDSYHSQLEVDYNASQETIDELRKKCDHYQASLFQFEKKAREERREWQETTEQELRLLMEVSLHDKVATIEAEMKNMRQKLDDCKAAQTVEISTIRNQFARASNQAASAHAQKISELVSQNEACMQRIVQLQQLCQALQKGNFSEHFSSSMKLL